MDDLFFCLTVLLIVLIVTSVLFIIIEGTRKDRIFIQDCWESGITGKIVLCLVGIVVLPIVGCIGLVLASAAFTSLYTMWQSEAIRIAAMNCAILGLKAIALEALCLLVINWRERRDAQTNLRFAVISMPLWIFLFLLPSEFWAKDSMGWSGLFLSALFAAIVVGIIVSVIKRIRDFR
ncbi:MAG: hypothetical protein IPP13_21990 [Kouleothrix sp.]|jgi:hypothetical protein|nr:hypothetical protein [Kouleothrix sp.]